MAPLTKEKALRVLQEPSIIIKDPDAVVVDDHRWCHMWAKTLQRKDHLFLSDTQLIRLHEIYVDEFMKRGLNHRSSLDFSAINVIKGVEMILTGKPTEFQVDDEFISIVGSSVLGKQDAPDIDLLIKAIPSESLREILVDKLVTSLPEELKGKIDFVWQPSGPNGPYIPLYQLKAVPLEQIAFKEPSYHMAPLAPYPPPAPRALMTSSDLPDLLEDSYFIIPVEGMRLSIHRRENQLMVFDGDQDEYELPEPIRQELLAIKDPRVFVIDAYLASDKKILNIVDLPWWRESEHINECMEARRYFVDKLPESEHVKRLCKYFPNRREAIAYLKDESGPYTLIPGSTLYPVDGSESEWLVYEQKPNLNLAESSDVEIKRRVDDGSWEDMPADKRFSLMTRRTTVEPLYPFAQLKTIKKGYSQREVFGLKSVKTLADDVFKVPNKEAVEVKIDGFRMQIHRKGDRVRIFTESGHEITSRLPNVVKSAKSIPAQSFILDSEGTPYAEDLSNLGRAGAAPAFAEGAREPFDDSRFVGHIYDILYLDGRDVHDQSYEERRKILHGLELPIRDAPKDNGDFRMLLWENNVNWATSAEQMIKQAEQVSKAPGSEGAMFKQADSKYRLSGGTPLWAKMKNSFDVDSLVVGISKIGSAYNYIGAVGPVPDVKDAEPAPLDDQKGKKFVKWKSRTYSVLGKTFNTKLEAKVGDIIRVSVKDMAPIEKNVYHWFHPQVLEIREDKTQPDTITVPEVISKTARGQQKSVVNASRKAYLVSSRFGEVSTLACCMASWVAVQTDDGFTYLSNSDDVYVKMVELGVTQIYGTKMEREPMEKLMEAGIVFHKVDNGSLDDLLSPKILLENIDPALGLDDIKNALAFQNELKDDPEGYNALKLSCGSYVPLDPINMQGNPYMTIPNEEKTWRFVVQMHIRGLSVHTDFRAQISPSELIGWTWDLGKSLLKPMLRRLSDTTLSKAGVTRAEIKDMAIKDLSAKIHGSAEGRKLLEILTQKTQDLPVSTLKEMVNELWREEVEPILKDPNRKIMTQKKGTMSTAWLDEEGEIKPGTVGATSELEGQIIIMDRGTVEYGTQKPYFNEYWIHGNKIKGRTLVRRLSTRPEWNIKESFSWLTFFPKPEEKPYAISRRSVQQKWYPPKGISALPKNIRIQIPHEYQYWKLPSTSHETRDTLVDEITKHRVTLKMASKSAQFAVKRVWHKGPEVQRGLPVVRYWLLIHDGNKVLDAWDFGLDTDPTAETGITAKRRDVKQLDDLLPITGELPATHPASETKALTNHFDTVDSGAVSFTMDKESLLQLKLNGKKLKGSYVFVREDPRSDMWIFNVASTGEEAALKMASDASVSQVGAFGDITAEMKGDILIISGPVIKPGEWIPGNTGTPNYFTKEAIAIYFKQAHRKPIGVYHGDLKGDVVGYMDQVSLDEKTGELRLERGVIWHPVAIALILSGKLPSFSIEVVPETIWDPEHQHAHVIGGIFKGADLVPKGACKTCNIDSAVFGFTKPSDGAKIYKFGLNLSDYLTSLYWGKGLSTQAISDREGIPRSTIENWMEEAGTPRRDLQEARSLRSMNEVLKMSGNPRIIALGTGGVQCNKCIECNECSQCIEYKAGGRSRRKPVALLFTTDTDQLLINAPKGIAAMLKLYGAKPGFVILDEGKQALEGLHELTSLKPMVGAFEETWTNLRQNYKEISGKDIPFEEVYDFPRLILRDKPTIVGKKGRLILTPIPSAHGFKILMADSTIWNSIQPVKNPKKLLEDVDIYIGGAPTLASIEDQLGWIKDTNIQSVFFTGIGHVGKNHGELNTWLSERRPDSQALYDSAEVTIAKTSPSVVLPRRIAEKLLNGEIDTLVKAKPYQDYSKQVIYLIGGDEILALIVEGLPTGPLEATEAKKQNHGMTDNEWKKIIGSASKVWVYKPKIVKRYEVPKKVIINPGFAEPYLRNTRIAL